MADLAQRLNTSVSSVNRLEKGEREMSVEELVRLAAILEAPFEAIVPAMAAGAPSPPGLREDAEPFHGGGPNEITLPDNRVAWHVTTDALSAIGIEPGDSIIVDISAEAVEQAGTGDAVVVQHYGPGMSARTLLRQFIEPDLLVTNSRGTNAAPLRRGHDDVAIKGVIVSRMQAVRRGRG